MTYFANYYYILEIHLSRLMIYYDSTYLGFQFSTSEILELTIDQEKLISIERD